MILKYFQPFLLLATWPLVLELPELQGRLSELSASNGTQTQNSVIKMHNASYRL
jgi:hypothetical protein